MNHAVIASIALAVQFSQASVAAPPPANSMPGYVYDVPFFPGSTYDDAIPTPDAVIGARVGEQPASHAQIEAVIKSLSTAGKRCRLFEYGRTHEGRALYYLVISAQRHIDRLDAIRADMQRLADPRGVTSVETDRLAESTPAIAWMAYVIHGNEMSGSDAALALAHHLIASRDAEVSQMLDELVVVIDPLMNPDGRDRCIGAIREARGAQPGVDDQTLIHTQFWPSGRGNHYLFDLNRDWIFCTQPESRGRVRAVRQWHPQYFMESHEMGSESTFLFMPPREPINLHIAQEIHKWQREFGNDQAAAFDQRGWRYYTGEWNEEWYPGYSGSWAALGGAIDNLYEQASIDADAIRRQEGTLETYRESVHHQLVSSWANLQTLQRNRRSIMRDYAIQRRRNVAADGPYARRLFAMLPDAPESRVAAMRDLCDAQAFELRVARNPFRASGRDRLGQVVTNREFPAGTLLLSAAQPEAPLIAAMFEFDPRMRPEFLREERRELLRRGQSRLYDVTGWCIPMLLDIETFELSAELPRDAALHGMAATMTAAATAAAPATSPAAIVAHAVDGSDDRSVAFAGRLMERGIRVRVAEKRFELGGVRMPRGSVVVLSQDNQPRAASLSEAVDIAARELGIIARPLVTGMGQGDLPDLGGGYFLLQEQPRIAVVGREPFSGYSYGETWHLVDHVLGLRASYLNGTAFTRADLRRYNVIVLPDGGSAA